MKEQGEEEGRNAFVLSTLFDYAIGRSTEVKGEGGRTFWMRQETTGIGKGSG